MASANVNDVLLLPAQLTIGDAEAFHDSLMPLLEQSAALIDASQVDRIDTAAFQQLLALKNSLAASDIPIQWVALSERFVQSAKQLGLDEVLGISNA